MGFGPRACKWVSIMLQNTTATAAFNGWQSPSFPERSGVQQGSPLSPLLYVLAAQPLASHLRRQAQQGGIRSITMRQMHLFWLDTFCLLESCHLTDFVTGGRRTLFH